MIVVVGMAFEARIAAGLGVPVVCGGDGQNLAASLARAMAAGCGGLISFGVAGGLAPDLKPGTCVIGSAILDGDAAAADRRALGAAADAHHSRRGLRSDRRRARADRACRPTSAPCTSETGAIAVDMESHVVARAAAQHGVPVAAIRVVVDPAQRTIPRSALAGTRADGTIDALAHHALADALSARPRRADPDVVRRARGARHAGARQRAARSRSRPARCRAGAGRGSSWRLDGELVAPVDA